MRKKKFWKNAAAVFLMAVSFAAGAEQAGIRAGYAQVAEQETDAETDGIWLAENDAEEDVTSMEWSSEATPSPSPEWTVSKEEVTRLKFRMFLCICFGVGLSVVIAIWGNPNERLKDRYKRARKQQQKAEKARLAEEKKKQKEHEGNEENKENK